MKIIYKILNTLAVLAIIPVLMFLPMFRFIMVVGMNSSNQILSLIGGVLNINQIIASVSGIDFEHLPEYYTIKNALDMFVGENASFNSAGFDMSALPESLVKFFTAAGVLFILALVCALFTLIIGLFTKKKLLSAAFSAFGFALVFAANKCFSYIASQLVSGKMSLVQIISGMEALGKYESYLQYIDLDIRIFELTSAYTMLLIVFGLLVVLNIIFHLADSVSEK